MNEFVLYQQLCSLESIAARYPAGKETACRLHQTAERIASQLYRVAVIGEFKRGKSSLINAIMGAEVLPTDILPMTAAITRITYGEKRRILIRYKDGREEERTVEELLDFATKADAQKEKRAETIREIEVRYPSVFCKNHIDIIDTPGLNDNAAMTEVTLSILGDVDAAIMVISAREPLSMTEQELILKLIAEKGIRHIVFVVTHIDAVSNRKSQQDRIINYICDRITGELQNKAKARFYENPALLEKTERILSQPDIFGVSSVLAMEGFSRDDLDLLEESRFPIFKQELFALLTAAQSTDVRLKTLDSAAQVRDGLSKWKSAADAVAEEEKTRLEICRDVQDACRESGTQALNAWLRHMDGTLAAQGLTLLDLENSVFERNLRERFVCALREITEETNSHETVLCALQTAEAEVNTIMEATSVAMLENIHREMAVISNRFEKIRALAQLPEMREEASIEMPKAFFWREQIRPEGILLNADVMPHINKAIHQSVLGWMGDLQFYIAAWQKHFQSQMAIAVSNADSVPIRKALSKLEEQRKLDDLQYRLDTEQLSGILTLLEDQK